MESEVSKVAVRYGTIEFEFEGSEDFIKEGLLDLISDAMELGNTNPASDVSSQRMSPGQPLNISVKTMSAKLGNSTGSDLARAAAAYLTLVQNRETFSQAEILNAMKSAVGIYKRSTHGKNSGKIILNLVSNGVLLETAAGTFALAEAQREQISRMLNG
jgi:hypothetical protein